MTRDKQPSAPNVHINSHSPVGIAKSLYPLLMEQADQSEQSGQISPKLFKSLHDSGLFQMMFPKRSGGVGRELIEHIETVAELAKGDPGSAWAFGLLSSVTASTASLPSDVTSRVFKQGTELLCSVAARTGTATLTDDGFIVNGSWGYASGCRHASWAMNGVTIQDSTGTVIDYGFAIMPLSGDPAVTIKDTWHVTGVCASGSNTIVADGLKLDAPLVLQFSKLRQGQSDDPALLAQLEPRDKWPVEPLFPLTVLAPMLGAAQGLLDLVQTAMPKRKIIGWHYDNQADADSLVEKLGEAALKIDSAWMHVRRAANLVDHESPRRSLTGFEKAQMQADCSHAMALVRQSAQSLMDIAGPGGFATSNPMQRLWRDINVGSRHNALNSHLSHLLYGRALLGDSSNLELLNDISQ